MQQRAWYESTIAGACVALVASVAMYTPTAAQWTGGLKGGMSATSFFGAVPEGTHSVRGFTAGGFVTSHLVADLSFQAELLYSQKGAGVEGPGSDGSPSGTLRLDYIDLPVMLRLDYRMLGPIRAHLLGGPFLGVNLSCRLTADGPGASDCSDADVGMEVHLLDPGLLGGAGASLRFGRAAVLVETRYQIGLTTAGASDGTRNGTNHGFTFLAGIAVPVGRRD